MFVGVRSDSERGMGEGRRRKGQGCAQANWKKGKEGKNKKVGSKEGRKSWASETYL